MRHDHELLDLEAVVGVRAAVEDVHQRRRKDARLRAAEVAIERQADRLRRRARDRHRDAEDGVRAELSLGARAIEIDHRLIERGLIERVAAQDLGRDLLHHVLDGLEHALAEVAGGVVSVTQLDRLVLARRGATRNRRAALSARGLDFHFDGGVSSRVEDLACKNSIDLGHDGPTSTSGDGQHRG